MKKHKKSHFRLFKWLIMFMFGGFLLHWLNKDKNKGYFRHLKENLSEFCREEKREIKELERRQEGWGKFCCDSGSLIKDYFVPHEHNGHKPRILRSRSLAVIVLAMLALKLSLAGYLFLSHPESARMSEAILQQVLALTNQDRAVAKVGELALDPVLSASAQAKADDLIINDYFAHYSPDGRKPWDFIDRGQYRYIYVGENLAMNFTTAESVHRALMASPSHKKNILNERYDEVGLAMASGMIDGKQTNVLVELFATKSEQKLAVNTENKTIPKVEEADELPSEPAPSPEVAGEASREAGNKESGPEPGEPPAEPIPAGEQEKTIARLSRDNFTSDKQKRSLPEPEPELVTTFTNHDELARAMTDPNPGLSLNQPAEITRVKNTQNSRLALSARIARGVNIAFAAILAILIVALIINIFVRINVQHRPVIIQTLLVILFVGSLLYFRLHALESGLGDILILAL